MENSNDQPIKQITNDKGLLIQAIVPGVDKQEIELEMTDSTCRIMSKNPEFKYHYFVSLEYMVEPKSTIATYKNGILSVHVKRKFETKVNVLDKNGVREVHIHKEKLDKVKKLKPLKNDIYESNIDQVKQWNDNNLLYTQILLPGVDRNDIDIQIGDSDFEINTYLPGFTYHNIILFNYESKPNTANAMIKNGVLTFKIMRKYNDKIGDLNYRKCNICGEILTTKNTRANGFDAILTLESKRYVGYLKGSRFIYYVKMMKSGGLSSPVYRYLDNNIYPGQMFFPPESTSRSFLKTVVNIPHEMYICSKCADTHIDNISKVNNKI